jgi:hypothetical protein
MKKNFKYVLGDSGFRNGFVADTILFLRVTQQCNAIITFHTDMVISRSLTQHDINTNSMEHSATCEVQTRSAL